MILFVVVHMVAVIAFFVCGRYRMPVVPALCVFAAFAVSELARLARGRAWGRVALSLAGLVVFGVLVNSDAYGVRRSRGANRDWLYLGQSYVRAENYQLAKEAFRQATHQNPKDADAYAELGRMEMMLGEPKAAAEDLVRSLKIAPDYTRVAALVAEIYLQQGWPLAEPQRLLRKALEYQPTNVAGLARLARVSIRKGDLEAAQTELDNAVAVLARVNKSDTRFPEVWAEVMRALTEAKQAGLRVPEGR